MDANDAPNDKQNTFGTTTSLNSAPEIPLNIARYRLTFNPVDARTLPAYSGSTWRGLFGHALKRSTCLMSATKCSSCILQHSCAYAYLFESSPPQNSERMRRYTTVQSPYVIEPEEEFNTQPTQSQSSSYTLGLTLFGRANHYLPNIIHAMKQLGSHGIGRTQQKSELTHVTQEQQLGNNSWQTLYDGQQAPLLATDITPPTIPESSNTTIEFHFLTPLRLRKNNRYIGADDLCFADLFNNLLRRISSLLYFHNQFTLNENFRELTHTSQGIDLSNRSLLWWDWERYSSRQNRKIKMGGLVGSVKLCSKEIAPYWPYLWLGQWTHAGKGTSMGLGKYRIKLTTENS